MPKKRSEIDQQYLWKIEDIYPTHDAWEADFNRLNSLLPDFPKPKNGFADSAGQLFDALKKIETAQMLGEKLFVYAKMRRDEDNADSLYQAMTDRAMSLNVKMSSLLSFIRPELLKKSPDTLRGFLSAHSDLKHEYGFMIEDLIRNKPHVLSEGEEKLLSMSADFAGGAQQVFTMLNNADLKFGSIDDGGEQKELSHASYIGFMQSDNRTTRRNAYEAMYGAFKANINTIAAAYATSVKKDIFYASARGFDSALARALFADNVPTTLYDNLIAAVHDNLSTMYDYVDLRKKVLGIQDLGMHDVYAPLVTGFTGEYPFEKAKTMVKAALVPLGEDYAALLDQAFQGGWIDVFENEGKLSGAYSWGTYGVHPYVLLNHNDRLDGVYTLAHELGHAMHSWYANDAQTYSNAGYTIFVAEVASTVNEILLTKHLLAGDPEPDLKKYILNHYIDQFKGTVVRQTMFAEFEKISHTMQESGQPLTPESLSEQYRALNRLYFGDAVDSDEYIALEWARIPHFYRAFYVYQYATGFSCAITIANNILKNGEPAVAAYKRFLQSGGSDYPLDELKIADVDLASGEPVDICMKEFKSALEALKSLF